MGTPATTLPTIDAAGFAARLAALFPAGWASPEAMRPGGAVYGVLATLGGPLAFELGALDYTFDACLIGTATNGALDGKALDYFGTGLYALPRLPGETDAAYAARILAAMLPAGATRPALQNALAAATGAPVRLIEPWRPSDTGVLDNADLAHLAYLDIDTFANPFRLTTGLNPNAAANDLGLEYQGFAECVLPPVAAFGNNPTPCLDEYSFTIDALGTGISNAAFLNPETSQIYGAAAVYNLINRVKAEGTTVWTKFVSLPIAVGWGPPN